MRAFFSRMNPTLRGLLIVALIALIVVALQLQSTLSVVSALLSIAFILAITFFVYLVWRERRAEIATWSLRARVTFYGAALLIVTDIGRAVTWYAGRPTLQAPVDHATLVRIDETLLPLPVVYLSAGVGPRWRERRGHETQVVLSRLPAVTSAVLGDGVWGTQKGS